MEEPVSPVATAIYSYDLKNHPTCFTFVKITTDRSTTESTANKSPSFGRDSTFGVRPGKRGLSQQVDRRMPNVTMTHMHE